MDAKGRLLPFLWILSVSCGDIGTNPNQKISKISNNLVKDVRESQSENAGENQTEQTVIITNDGGREEKTSEPEALASQEDHLEQESTGTQADSDEGLGLANSIDSIPALILQDSIEEGNIPLCGMNDAPDNDGFCTKSEEFESDGVAFICSKQKYSLTKTPNQLVAINPFADTLWPGSLIQSKPLMEGILNPVPTSARSTGSITMAIATDTTGVFSKNITEPSLASTTEAIKEILNTNINIDTPAKFYYKLTQVYSNKQLAVAVGLHVDTPFDFDIQTSLKFNSKEVKNRILIDFTQEYYTIAYAPKNGVKGFFNESVDPNELAAFMGEGNPLAYISSVSYGRKIFLLFESDASMSDLETAIKASFKGYGVTVGGDLAVKNKKVLSESQVKAYVIGGNAEDALEALNTPDEETGGTIVNLKQLMADGANFSKGNPGVPISYTVRHVKDASQIKLVLNTDYEARECTPVANVNNPMVWTLKVSLEEVAIDKENSFCDFGDEGEFSSCLKIAVGDGEEISVFCNDETRKAKPGQVLGYGQSNHSTLVEVKQSPGQTVKILGHVREHDFGSSFDEVVNFSKTFTLSQNYEWTDWSELNQVSGVEKGCKANLSYKLDWVDRFLSSN